MPLRLSVRVAATLLLACSIVWPAAEDDFETRVRPVLASRCYPCHSATSPAPQGGLRLDSAAAIRKGGNTGAAVTPGDPDTSLLIKAIRGTDAKLRMPPGKPLPAETIAIFEAWVKSGASMPPDRTVQTAAPEKPKLWSLRKPERPPVPAGGASPIDAFLLDKLKQKGLAFSPEADRHTLIRRVTFDLTGLPPSAEEVRNFVADTRADAYDRLVDRLLASPRYGERWGRHWLDVARYADSYNDSVNASQRFPWSYTYRDWVIRSLNEDLPYNDFLQYQLAADRLVQRGKAQPKHMAALGFLSLGREFPGSYPETVDDRIDAVARGMLGLTVACARCHDHKYDPIPTKDYYAFYSILSNIREPRDLPRLTNEVANPLDPKHATYTQRLARIDQAEKDYIARRTRERIAFFRTQIAEYLIAAHDSQKLGNTETEDLVRDRQLNTYMLRRWQKFLAATKQNDDPTFRTWHDMASGKPFDTAGAPPLIRSAAERTGAPSNLKELAAFYGAALGKEDETLLRGPDSPLAIPVEQFESVATEGDLNNLRSIRVRHRAMLSQAAYDGAEPRAMAVEDLPKPEPAHVFLRGNASNPGALAPARFLTCLGGSEDKLFSDGSGRLELARAVVDPDNPLTARVIVNRVWMHHFGSGLVRTPSDFGFRGDPPTHPELLDYLAATFTNDLGWSLKKLHRSIVTSAAYRQASTDNPTARGIDPENQLLWRMNRRRLEIEAVRDAALVAAGRLDLESAGGPPFLLNAEPSVPKRSVYGFIERERLPAFLNAFDFPSPDAHAAMRFVTTVPQQALYYMNSPFVAEQARHIAARTSSIPDMYRAVLSRDPEKWETEAAERFLSKQGDDDTVAKGQDVAVWQYGVWANDQFARFRTYAGDRWLGIGKAVLRGAGGEPDEHAAVVRRWTSPVSGTISIEGTLRHGQPAVPYGDGVHGTITSSRHGDVASWNVNGGSAETKLTGIKVEKGDTLDFIVDGRKDPENDGFSWSPTIRSGTQVWSASEDFGGPAPQPLNPRERLAQVLLLTSEFAFID